jgi:Na+/melibiose symporter-like transporter
MIADTIDESELSTGKRQEGMFNSAFTLMSKATSSVGGLIAGITIDVINLPTGAAVGEVDSDTLVYLGLAAGPGIVIFWFLALLVIRRYPLTREKHRAIIMQLTARRG